MRWLPAHDAHAIERVSATFEFAEPMPIKPWRLLLSEASLVLPARGFNTTEPVGPEVIQPPGQGGVLGGNQGIVIRFGVPGIGSPGIGPGSIFRVISGDVSREELSLFRNSFVFTTTVYDHWKNFKLRIQELLEDNVSKALDMTSLNVMKLEYWDRFIFDGPINTVEYKELLKIGSKYIPEFPSEMNELWHSHVGYFAPPGSSARRLLNFNLDVLDLVEAQQDAGSEAKARRSIGLYSLAQDTPRSDPSPRGLNDLLVPLDEMHNLLKDVLATAITDTAAKRISLYTEECA